MDKIFEKVNFSNLSRGEQEIIQRLTVKHEQGQSLKPKEEMFISDMAKRASKSTQFLINQK